MNLLRLYGMTYKETFLEKAKKTLQLYEYALSFPYWVLRLCKCLL